MPLEKLDNLKVIITVKLRMFKIYTLFLCLTGYEIALYFQGKKLK